MTETAPNFNAPTDHSDQALGPFLGEGAQYKVYDMGDRVRKVPQTIEGSVATMDRWHKGTEAEKADYAQQLAVLRQRGVEHVQGLMKWFPEMSEFFGNPTFYPDGSMDQDKMPSLSQAMREQPEMAENYLLQGTQNVVTAWRHGCYDRVFNTLSNSGVKDGKVIMRDFGEMGFAPEGMYGLLEKQPWLHTWEYKNKLTEGQQGFVRGVSSVLLTRENFDQNWGLDMGWDHPPRNPQS